MKNKIIFLKISLLSLVFIPFNYSCSGTSTNVQITPTPSPKLPLFLRIGNNKDALAVIVDDLMENIASDTSIKTKFSDLLNDTEQLKKFKDNMVNYICQISGGNCKYISDSNHKPITLDTNEYNTFRGNLTKTLEKFKLVDEDKNDLTTIFDPGKSGLNFFMLVTPTPVPTPRPSVSGLVSPSPSVIPSSQVSQSTSATPNVILVTPTPIVSPTPILK